MPPTLVFVHASPIHTETFYGQLKKQEPDIPAKQVVMSYFLYEVTHRAFQQSETKRRSPPTG